MFAKNSVKLEEFKSVGINEKLALDILNHLNESDEN